MTTVHWKEAVWTQPPEEILLSEREQRIRTLAALLRGGGKKEPLLRLIEILDRNTQELRRLRLRFPLQK
jgi:hypothetical protein